MCFTFVNLLNIHKNSVINPVLETRTLRYREVKQCAQGHSWKAVSQNELRKSGSKAQC